MCLEISFEKDQVDAARNRLIEQAVGEDGFIHAWKVYQIDIKSDWVFSSVIGAAAFLPGVVRGNRLGIELTTDELDFGEVELGIHVYLEEPVEKWPYLHQDLAHFAVRVRALPEDLVAVNVSDKQAVFLKVEVTPEALENILWVKPVTRANDVQESLARILAAKEAS